MTNEETFMIECITTELVEYVIDDLKHELTNGKVMF